MACVADRPARPALTDMFLEETEVEDANELRDKWSKAGRIHLADLYREETEVEDANEMRDKWSDEPLTALLEIMSEKTKERIFEDKLPDYYKPFLSMAAWRTLQSLEWTTNPIKLPVIHTRDEYRFDRLCSIWKRDCAFKSSISEISMHAAYQEIIGMGEVAIPFILKELKRELDHWFWALTYISGQNPIPSWARGKMKVMKDAWLSWGEENGYI